MSAQNDIKLESEDKEVFTVPFHVISQSRTICYLIQTLVPNDQDIPIPLVYISAFTFEKVLEWCHQHVGDPQGPVELSTWDRDFIRTDKFILIDILLAAIWLDISALVDTCCKGFADGPHDPNLYMCLPRPIVEQIEKERNQKSE